MHFDPSSSPIASRYERNWLPDGSERVSFTCRFCFGWTKAAELAKVARRDGQKFDCATWLHKAQELPKEEFKREVERHLTGKETEPWEMLYFKVYKSQLAV